MGRPQYPPPPLMEPGWYQDPTARFEARYWDGGHWTGHISHYGATGSDPLMAARFDNVWVRWTGRLVFWALLVGLGWWGFDRFWPTDDRDLVADQELVDAVLLTPSELPTGFDRPITAALSPLRRTDTEEALDACVGLGERTVDLAEEPSAVRGFATAGGDVISQASVIAGAGEGVEAYLEALRGDDAGDCLIALWAERFVAAAPGAALTAASARAMGTPSLGDDAVWWRLSGDLESRSGTSEVFADVIIVGVGRVASQFAFQGVGTAVNVGLHRQVIAPVLADFEQALGALDGSGERPDAAGGG